MSEDTTNGNVYVTNDGRRFLVLEGSFVKWGEYLDKHPDVADGSFRCEVSRKGAHRNLVRIEDGIYKIVE